MQNKRLVVCKTCGTTISKNAKVCPRCGAKNSKPIYDRWWFWTIIIIFIMASMGNSSGEDNSNSNSSTVLDNTEIKQAVEKQEIETDNEIENTEPPFSKEDCVEFDYKTYARNPDNYVGNAVKVRVEVAQIMDGGLFNSDFKYYRCYAYDESQEYLKTDYDKIYLIYDYRGENSEKILDGDIIEVYGNFKGAENVTYALTKTKGEVLAINMFDSILIETED